MKQRINIMSSSDYRLLKFLPTTLVNIADKLASIYDISFYFVYKDDRLMYKVTELNDLAVFAKSLNIEFIPIAVNEPWLAKIQQYGGVYPEECYYYMFADKILPTDVERVLYMDVADILILGDIKDFYFCNFRDKAFCITSALTESKMTPFQGSEIIEKNRYAFKRFSKSKFGLFNSGFIMVNVNRLRKLSYSPQDFVDFAERWHAEIGENYIYCGDQCFISAYFLTEIQSTYFPKTHGFFIIRDIRDISNQDQNIDFKAVHFVSLFNNLKPWHISEKILSYLKPFKYVLYHKCIMTAFSPEAIRLFRLWWDYCKKTPYYTRIVSESDDSKLIKGLIQQIENAVKSIDRYEKTV